MIAARYAKVEGPHYGHCWCSRLPLQSLLLCIVCIEGNSRPALWFSLPKFCVRYTPRTSVEPCETFYVKLSVNNTLVTCVYTSQFFFCAFLSLDTNLILIACYSPFLSNSFQSAATTNCSGFTQGSEVCL